jgi:hypothetical protein
MADWTNLPNTAVGVGGLPSGTTVTALRDNPIAIADGAAGAPRVVDGALDTTATNTGRDWVIARYLLAAAGDVGTYVFARDGNNNVTFGDTRAGSNLNPTAAAQEVGGTGTTGAGLGAALSGTWRCMGRHNADILVGTEPNRFIKFATLWLRIA